MDEQQLIQVVRTLIGDTGDDPAFSDMEITAMLSLEGDNVWLAAADLLDVLATSIAKQMKCVTILDVTVNGQQTAAAIRESAAALRDRAAKEDEQTIQCGVVSVTPPHVPTLFRPWWEALA